MGDQGCKSSDWCFPCRYLEVISLEFLICAFYGSLVKKLYNSNWWVIGDIFISLHNVQLSSSHLLRNFIRYCVLWAFGGFYSDDDSFIGTPLSTIVQQNDSMILTPEKGAYVECYHPSYELSRESQNRTNVNQIQLSSSYDRPIVNWAIFSEPGSLVLENALRNIVDIFKYEYFRRSVIHIKHNQMRAYNVFCSTGQWYAFNILYFVFYFVGHIYCILLYVEFRFIQIIIYSNLLYIIICFI